MRIAVLAVFIALLAGPAMAQGRGTPSFAAYPAKVERPRAKAINFRSNPDARTFRTRLSEALRGGVNFAGHYVLTGWGCGTGCVHGAVIDARNGRVYFPEEMAGIAVGHTDNEYDEPITYRKNSRLIVVSGIPGNAIEGRPEKPDGTYYFEWKNNRLRQVRYIPRKTN